MWMVGGIKLKLTRAQNFFCRRTRKSVKTEIFYSSGRYSETMRDIRMGHNRSNDCWCTGDQMPFWRILAAGQFWLCFGHPKSVEGDQMRSVRKNMRCHKKLKRPQFSKYRFHNQSASFHRCWAHADCYNLKNGNVSVFCDTAFAFFLERFCRRFSDCNVRLILHCVVQKKSAPSNVYLTGKDEYLIRTTKYLNLQILNKFV